MTSSLGRAPWLLLLLSACAHPAVTPPAPQPTTTRSAAAKPVAAKPVAAKPVARVPVAQLLKRERPPMGKRPLLGPQGAFAGQVEALAAPTIKKSTSFTYVTIPIGTVVPVECFVYARIIDTAALLRSVVQRISRDATQRDPVQVSAGVVGNIPYLRLVAPYLVQRNTVPTLMTPKVVAFSYPSGALSCIHNEVGYTATFTRVVEGLAATLQIRGSTPVKAFSYADIGVVYLGDKTIGFVKTLETARGTTTTSVDFTSMLVPMHAGNLFAADFAGATTAEQGTIVHIKTAASVNGAMRYVLALRRVANGRYALKGEKEGQPIDLALDARQPLYTEREQALRARKHFLQQRATAPLTFLAYLPSSDPTKLSSVRFAQEQALKSSDDLAIRTEVDGRVIAHLVFDRHGRPRRLQTRLGALRIRVERRFSSAAGR